MFPHTTDLTPLELKSAIVPDPLIVAPETTVMEAIARMSGVRTLCETTKTSNRELDETILEARSSCVLVVEDDRLLGIFTERDVVRLSAQQRFLQNLTMREVASHPVITLKESAFTDLFFAVNLLQQYRIRHIPILDDRDRVVGLLTNESLRQISRPVDLLRLRLVSEVMASEVICATPESSMLAIAQLMAEHCVSCVLLVQTKTSASESLQIPVGIITERDIVQFQALELNLEIYLAQVVMSTPIFTIKASDSLWRVRQIMEQRSIRRLAVTGDRGELLGIVTQTSLLQAFNPLELYKLAEVLEEKVVRLEAEKIELLQTRTVELEQQIETRTISLKSKVEREKLVAGIAMQIRSSLSLQAILDTTVEQIRLVLGCDRVNISQFEAEWQSIFVAESTNSSMSLLGERIIEKCVREDLTEVYRQGRIRIVSDIYATEMSDCHRDLLIRLQTRAKILVPLLCCDKLWGLLNVSESQHARDWQPEEVELLQALSVHLTIAIQQATTHQKLQDELRERRQAETRLRESEQRYASLTAAAPVGIFSTDADGNSVYINQRCCEMLGLSPEETTSNGWQQALHPEDRERVLAETIRSRQENRPFQEEYRILRPDGTEIWVLGQAVTELDSEGKIIGYVGTITDITDRKRAELTLQKLLTGTAAVTGENFFLALARHLVEALNVRYAIVTKLVGDKLHTLGFWSNGSLQPSISFDPVGTPNEYVLLDGEFYCESQVQKLFPEDSDLVKIQAESYLGIVLKNDIGEAIGNLCILDIQPFGKTQYIEAIAILKVFAARAAAELQRKAATDALYCLNQELEERVESRTRELQAREAQLRDLFDNATDLIQSVTPQGRILFVNKAWKDTLGYADEDLEHLSIFQIIDPDERLNCQTAMEQLLAGDRFSSIETRFLTKEGREIVVEGNVNCQLENGVPIATRGIFRDITQRKQAEKALRESQQFLQTVLDSFPLFVFWKNRESVYLGCNQNFAVAARVSSPAEIVNKTDYDLPWGGSEADLYRADDRQVIESGTAKLGIIEPQHLANGETIWLETNKIPLRDLKGEVIGILGTYQDITDRQRAELALQSSEIRFRRIFDSNIVGMIFADFQGRILDANDRFLDMVGYTREELEMEAINWNAMTPSEHAPADWRAVEHLRQHGSIDPWEKEYYRKDGSRIPVLIGAATLPDTDNQTICVVVDISDRKQAERALTEYAGEIEDLYNNAPCGYHSLDPDTRYIRVNETELKWLGYSRDEMIGKPLIQFLTEASRQTFLQNFQLLQERGWVKNLEYEIICKDGTILPVMISATAVKDVNGNYLYNRATLVDMSDRKKADRAIRQQAEREKLLREITNRIRESLDLQTIFDTACQEIRQVIQADRVGIFQFSVASSFDEGKFVAESVLAEFPSVLAIPVRDHCFGANYSSLYIKGKYYAVDDIYNGGLTTCHTNILAQFEVRANLIVPLLCGNKLWGLLCVHQCATIRHWQQAEIDLTQQIGNQLAIAIQQANLYEQLQQELVERQKAEEKLTDTNQQLAISNEELIRATRLKDEFLANMSHELRTPLNAILGMTEGLQEGVFGTVNNRQIKALQTVERSGSHLLELINDILDVAKIESGQINLECTPTAIAPLCQSSLVFIKQQALKKRIQLEIKLAANLPLISLDERRIRQVLINLLNNAVKFTLDGGRITLEVTIVNTDLANGDSLATDYLRIAVIDTGIGIAPENINKLFKPFIQIDTALNRQYSGTGLGLALVKRIVELHGGRVELTSKLGVGSCFAIELPRLTDCQVLFKTIADERPVVSAELDSPTADRTVAKLPLILLAEDNEANVETVSDYLEAKGYSLIYAKNGLEAIELAITHQPDLILMDIQMPKMDGLEAIRQIRRDPNLVNIPIIALTALAMTSDRDRCLAAGANDYLSKPVKLKELATTIEQLLTASKNGEGF